VATNQQAYAVDNAWVHARERLRLLEECLDSGSIRRLDALGVGDGWRCLEIGAGGGSITEWLCRRVGPSGYVLATDIDTRFLDVLDFPNLEVRRHNILTDPLPEEGFDLVYARAVLEHLVDRDFVLDRLVSAIKPGGWLLIEDGDYSSWVPDPRFHAADRYARYSVAAFQAVAAAGWDRFYPRRLFRDVRAAGLLNVDAEGRVSVLRSGNTVERFWQLTCTQVRERVVSAGLLTQAEMDDFLALHDDEDFSCLGPVVLAVWGRKPGSRT
jgi:SAM-dependent methyltransferase